MDGCDWRISSPGIASSQCRILRSYELEVFKCLRGLVVVVAAVAVELPGRLSVEI